MSKLDLFVENFHRKINVVDHKKSAFVLSAYDAHDFLTKYFFEGDLWQHDLKESFGERSYQDYFNVVSKRAEISFFFRETPNYIADIWLKDFVEIYHFPETHIILIAQKVGE